ncbi:MAG: adenylate/guanylate cyclase domain-containing protein [Actinobacteria bacterium]|nr:adenylate/guanylate cyclase domain-containing protein [Actinomycetota bacterium]
MARGEGLKRLRKSVWYRVAVVMLLAVSFGALSGIAHSAGVFGLFRMQLGDRIFPRGDTDPRVLVVGVDDRSLNTVQAVWPWPRELQADLVSRLLDAGAHVVAFDVTFDAPRPGDEVLAAAIEGEPVVLAVDAAVLTRQPDGRRAYRATEGIRLPAQPLFEAAAAVGLVNVQGDTDGVVRSVPLIAETRETDVPTLGLAAFMLAEGIEGPIVQRPFGIEVGGETIPTEEGKLLRVNFSPELSPGETLGSGTANEVPFTSAADILNGTALSNVSGKIVLIGATAQILQDFRQTPVAKQNLGVPGVFLHANVLNTLLTEEYVEDASTGETVAWVVFLVAAIGLLSWLAPLRFGVAMSVLLLVAWLLWSLARFEAGVIPDFLYPPLAALVALMAGLVLRYVTEGRARRRVSALFAQYVPPAVAERLVNEDRVDAVMAGERLDVSVLFCDLRGFTAQAATMEPAQVRRMLDTYYERLSQIVLDHGGTVMQYVGDEIYAAFGAPEIQEDHASRALSCAIAMQQARPAIGEELEAHGLPPIRYGIGVNSGSVVSAIVGSAKKSQYSLVGDTVNIGARLCSQAREDQVCFPDHVREAAGTGAPGEMEDLGPIEFKNATRPIRVWRYWAHRPEADPSPTTPDLTALSAKSSPHG